MRKICLVIFLVPFILFSATPSVRNERPRIFLRDTVWSGPSVNEISGWMNRSDYTSRIGSLRNDNVGEALYYVITKDSSAGAKSVANLKTLQITGSSSSYAGISAERYGAMYDWLRNHPDFDSVSRHRCVAHMEVWADSFMHELEVGFMPFYSRSAGALAGLTVLALSLYGDSPKAPQYLAFAENFLKNKLGTIREGEDGATGGGSYGYYHVFTDYANLVAAWRSATDWDAALWIKENQGNWLQRQMEFQIWTTYHNGWFVKHGDISSGSFRDNNQFRVHIDAISGMYRDGIGRAWAADMYRRLNISDYWYEYVWEYFLFNNPSIPETPLTQLPKTAVFGDSLHRYVVMRSGWGAKDAVIHFLCGETVDHHATHDQGKFMLFKETPLAIKNGMYDSYMSPMHMYYQSPWSANAVVLTRSNHYGYQQKIEVGGLTDWTGWLDYRSKIARQPTGRIIERETTADFARVKGDFSGAWPVSTAWTRELIFLKYKYLIVIDKITAGNGYVHRWLLHSIKTPVINGTTATITNGIGRLYCKTLLPVNPRISVLNSQVQPYYHVNFRGVETILNSTTFLPGNNTPERRLGAGRLEIMPPDSAIYSTYLHVLYPTDTTEKSMPACSLSGAAGIYTVHIGDASYTIKDSTISVENNGHYVNLPFVLVGPNPFSNKIRYSVQTDGYNGIEVRIVSVDGRLVYSRNYSTTGGIQKYSFSWDAKKVRTGVYLMSVKSGKKHWNGKIVLH
ncbi:MAG: T9SS type A sorting domain-containing protein [Fibrobacteres bacterium]|nr:T9SS type A sorting domain-containing protein [Fibrobacterota bacterium]